MASEPDILNRLYREMNKHFGSHEMMGMGKNFGSQTGDGNAPVDAADTQTASLDVASAGQGEPWWFKELDARMRDCDLAMQFVRSEVVDITRRYPPFNSSHEGWGVIMEEAYELFLAVHANDKAQAKREAIQLAATCIRYIAEIRFR